MTCDLAAVAVQRAAADLAAAQAADGTWRGLYGGPTFLVPLYVLAHRATGEQIRPEVVRELRVQLLSYVNDDGSVGLAAGQPGCLFATAINYVTRRMLGELPDQDALAQTRSWIRRQGGPVKAAQWGKFFLALAGLYDYRGLHPILPELWLVPRGLPIHPGRLQCQTRQLYLPMSWLYATRAVVDIDQALIAQLREELYPQRYEGIDWAAHRSDTAACDDFRPLSPLFKAASAVQRGFESAPSQVLAPVRRKALDTVVAQLRYQDRVTGGLTLSSAGCALTAIVHQLRSPGSDDVQRSMVGLEGHLWRGEGRAEVQGADSALVWETALAAQALAAASAHTGHTAAARARHYLAGAQLATDPAERKAYWRERSAGGWTFSAPKVGWPVSDCTAEAVIALLAAQRGAEPGLPAIEPACDYPAALGLLLDWQNRDGGWSSYEPVRATARLEMLSSVQVMDECMVETSCTECTASVLVALERLHATGVANPGAIRAISRAQAKAARYLLRTQRPDGGFEGRWALCFTYGTWFGIRGLIACGLDTGHPAVRRAAAFLIDQQRPDGGWGESPDAARQRRYIQADHGHCVMTAWAVLGLCAAGLHTHPATLAGVRYLLARQQADGSFPDDGYAGLTFRTLLLDYPNYRRIFPLWALGEWLQQAAR